MRYGFRRPSVRKSISARTTDRLNRSVKRAFNPYYGRKGMGYLHNPKRAIYNGIYHRTTVSPIPRSSTKAYRHRYYMIHKYGYVPDDDWINQQTSTLQNEEGTDALDTPEERAEMYNSNWYRSNNISAKQRKANDAAMAKVAKRNHQSFERKKQHIKNFIHMIFHFWKY